MAKTTEYAVPVIILLLMLLPEHIAGAESATAATVRNRPVPRLSDVNFIKTSCTVTRYPALCVHSLSGYAAAIRRNNRHLAQAALLVSLSRASSAAHFVSRLAHSRGLGPWDHNAVKDCVENMGDTVDRLSQSMRELGRTGQETGQEFEWHVSNVQTWVSAALTDENTCMDGFSERRVGNERLKAVVRRRIAGVAQVTSNALALVNRFASKRRAMEEP